MVDIFKPEHNIHFTVDDLLKRKHESSVFINTLTDLNKLISFEQRDAFEDRNIRVENPDWTDWDRFAIP
jgi:serine/threonine-protein phosphatase 2A regulatory subunit B''